MPAREKPILFSAPMIRAILEGRKWQTRRILNLSRAVGEPDVPPGHVLDLIYPGSVQHYGYVTPAGQSPSWRVQRLCDASCEHTDGVGGYDGRHATAWGPLTYAPGDHLWVKETHAKFMIGEGRDRSVQQCVAYRATCDADEFDYTNGRGEVMRLTVTKWTPSMFMPRWASRLTLEVTEVRVQRLHEITDEDAIAEGARHWPDIPDPHPYGQGARWSFGTPTSTDHCLGTARLAFASLWDSINGKSRAWASNPWVLAISFRWLR